MTSTTPTAEAAERMNHATNTAADFEAWAAANGYNTIRRNDAASTDIYFSYETEQRWIVWQAARATQASAEPVAWPEFKVGAMYDSTSHGPVKFVGMDTFHGETTYQFKSSQYGNCYWKREALSYHLAAPERAPSIDSAGELDRLKRMAGCSTTQSFLALPDEDKANFFALAMDESERCKKAEARLEFLHSLNKDADGWEWGVARVRWDGQGRVEVLWGLSDHSDIDAAAAMQPQGNGGANE